MHRIAETFNKEFEEVARLKQAEIARIREKNVRISKIIQQLQLKEELVQPSLQPEEQPEGMLTVQVIHKTCVLPLCYLLTLFSSPNYAVVCFATQLFNCTS